MGEKTAISWCDYTFNPWEGCEKISPGCKNCYAAALNAWLRKGENWGPDGTRRFFGAAHWRKPIAWDAAALAASVRRRVFCASVGDVFEDRDELAEHRERLWALIDRCRNLDWLLLTKRPENFDRMLPWGMGGPFAHAWPHVWLGVTAEDQEHAAQRIPILQTTAAAVRFVSYEPALGPIDWRRFLSISPNIHWVIFGDESGRGRRDAELEWARETRDACVKHGVAFHFKQWCGGDVSGVAGDRDRRRKIHLPILDGSRHAAFPEVSR